MARNRGFGGSSMKKPPKLGGGKVSLKGDMHGGKKGIGKTSK